MTGGQGEQFNRLYHSTHDIPAKRPLPNPLNVGDFFCGAGGFSEGFHRAGFHIALGVDKDHNATSSWKLNNRAGKKHQIDVRDLIREKGNGTILLPETHVALFSPPCQGFSTANPGGKNDEDNREVLGCVIEIVHSLQPTLVVLENVPGLTNHANRPHLCKLNLGFLAQGYAVSWRVQCASNFGVPQTRRRMILYAARLGNTLPDFPAPTHMWNPPEHLQALVDLRSTIWDLNQDNPRHDNDKGDTEYVKKTPTGSVIEIHNHATGYRRSEAKIYPKAEWDDLSSTVRTSPGNRWRCVHPDGHRLLTVRELCRIQSLPDSWELSGEIKDQYKQVGNAVPPLLAEAWAREVRKALLKDYPELNDQFGGAEVTRTTSLTSLTTTLESSNKRGAAEIDSDAEEVERGSKRPRAD
ncbi:S-adenosyl-L-methionine-dependent methyltransferase [Mycena rebaudengoi]|nr:S-adenosyl-L-methionine-dependent methyltransferase [Mycena rebaudengoi]